MVILLIKYNKNLTTILILIFSLLQTSIFFSIYHYTDPKEFSSMVNQVITNGSMRIVILIIVALILIASILLSYFFSKIFAFITTKIYQNEGKYNDFQNSFLVFLIILIIQPLINILLSNTIDINFPLMQILAVCFILWRLVSISGNWTKSIAFSTIIAISIFIINRIN